jgi:hypothetical protein
MWGAKLTVSSGGQSCNTMKAFKIITPAAVAAVALAACRSGPKPGPGPGVEQRLSSIMGADISTAVGILGFPDERKQEPGRLIYVWSTDRAARLPRSEIRMGSYANHTDGVSEGAPCRVELSADDAGRIAGYQWSGSDAHCSWVVQAFTRAEHEDQGR